MFSIEFHSIGLYILIRFFGFIDSGLILFFNKFRLQFKDRLHLDWKFMVQRTKDLFIDLSCQ